MNPNCDRRSRLEEADRGIRRLRWTVGIESEIIQGSPTNGVRVLVLREGLRTPAQVAGGLICRPDRVAKSRVPLGSVLSKSRMIERGVKPQAAHRYSASERNANGLDSAIQILVVESVFIMPNAGRWIRHFVGDERASVASRHGLDHAKGRSSPGINGRSHAHCGANGRKGVRTRRAVDIEPTVGCVVVHVALPGVGLAPGVLMRSNVLRFGIVGRT